VTIALSTPSGRTALLELPGIGCGVGSTSATGILPTCESRHVVRRCVTFENQFCRSLCPHLLALGSNEYISVPGIKHFDQYTLGKACLLPLSKNLYTLEKGGSPTRTSVLRWVEVGSVHKEFSNKLFEYKKRGGIRSKRKKENNQDPFQPPMGHKQNKSHFCSCLLLEFLELVDHESTIYLRFLCRQMSSQKALSCAL
jgi:hypothetical protein